MIGSKQAALIELEVAIKEFNLSPTQVGLDISGNRSFMTLMREPTKTITTKTLDKVNKFVLSLRGQKELELELKSANKGNPE